MTSNYYCVSQYTRHAFIPTIVMTKTTLLILLALAGAALSSCKTYYIPVDNFRKLYEGMGPDSLNKEITIRGPLNEKITYLTYPIDFIYGIDRKGNPVVLKNTPTLKVEIIYSNNEKSVVNFQSIRVNNGRISNMEISKQGEYFNMLSPINTTPPGDTLNKLDQNRAPSSYYVYKNVPYENRTKDIQINEIKKITVLHW